MIIFRDVSKFYGRLAVLKDFNIQIETGEVVCLHGPSGVGKTTILKIIAGLVAIDKGSLYIDERKKIGYVFQEPRLLPWCNILENVEIGLYRLLPGDKSARKSLAIDLLDKVGLGGFENYLPAQLSGGMKQRVALARAFAIKPDILLLDEPFNALDDEIKNTLQRYLFDLLAWKPCTTILVTHNIEEAVKIGDRILFLKDRPCRVLYEQIIDAPRNKRDISYWLHAIRQSVAQMEVAL